MHYLVHNHAAGRGDAAAFFIQSLHDLLYIWHNPSLSEFHVQHISRDGPPDASHRAYERTTLLVYLLSSLPSNPCLGATTSDMPNQAVTISTIVPPAARSV